MLFEDRAEVRAITVVERFDQPMDARRHHQQVARRPRGRVPVRVRRPARDEEPFAGSDFNLLVADPKAELSLEDDPGLVVRTVQMERRDGKPGIAA